MDDKKEITMDDKELARFVEAVATALLLEVVNRGETMMEARQRCT